MNTYARRKSRGLIFGISGRGTRASPAMTLDTARGLCVHAGDEQEISRWTGPLATGNVNKIQIDRLKHGAVRVYQDWRFFGVWPADLGDFTAALGLC